MTCDELHEHLDPFFDNELGLAEAQKIQQHLEQCSGCGEVYAARLAVRQALQKPEVRFTSPDDLRDQIQAELSKQVRPAHQATWRLPSFQFPTWLMPSLAGAAAVLAVWFGSNVFLTAKRSSNDLLGTVTAQLVSDHMRSLLPEHLIDVVSTDQHTVKPWFAGKLSFSPPVYDLSDHGFKLIGGRLDYLGNQEIAAVVFQIRQHYINLFVWPKTEYTYLPDTLVQKEGFNMYGWEANGLTMCAVTDAAPDALKAFVDLQKQKHAETE
ncbi:MAG: anti-sigma factor [Verrucomicrobia bacterium]|nr:anti-sigma factor [Verrucomicrobiota bacterium]MBV8276698.1 anti-sigma factor [Verrucomicrobiota bacterium]